MNVQPTTADQEAHLARWRALALQRMPYLAAVLYAVTPVDAPGLGTFAVDPSWRLYVDFAAVEPRGETACSEDLLHEALHLVGNHAARARDVGATTPQGRPADPIAGKAWNYAADAAINDDLVEAGCTTIGATGVLPERLGLPAHRTPEWYYRELRAKLPPTPPEDAAREIGSGSEGHDGQPYTGCGSGAGARPAPCELGTGHDPGFAPEVDETSRQYAALAVAAAIRQAAGQGSVPAGLTEMADMILTPTSTPWQRVLRAAIRHGALTRAGDADYSYTRPHRRRGGVSIGAGRKVIFPSMVSPAPKIAFVRDTSASMSARELEEVSGEVFTLSLKLGIRGDDLVVIDVDAKAGSVRGYAGAKTLTEVTGRGGTDMRVGVEAALALTPRPNAIIVGTDGYTDWPEVKPRGVAIIAAIVGDPDTSVYGAIPSFVTVVKVPRQARRDR